LRCRANIACLSTRLIPAIIAIIDVVMGEVDR